MRQALTPLHCYCSEWKSKVNCDKTEIVGESSNKYNKSSYNFQLGGDEIEEVSVCKYLGVLLNCNGRFRKAELALNQQAARTMY